MTTRRAALLLLAVLGPSLWTACGRPRVQKPVEGSVEIPQGVHTVRIEVTRGGLGAWPPAEGQGRTVTYSGRLMLAGETADALATLEAEDWRLENLGVADGVLRLRAPQVPETLAGEHNHAVHELIVRLPEDVGVELHTGRGHVEVVDRQAPVALSTAWGDARLARVHGDARIRIGEGSVVKLGDRHGSGNLIIDHHRGGLDIEIGDGMIQAFVDDLGEVGIRIESGHGGIQLHLPADAAFDLDARVPGGRASNGFGVEVAKSAPGREMIGEVHGGGPPVVLRARSGNVSIRAVRD